MKEVWKFTLSMNSIVSMPKDAEVLHVHRQGDDVCLWALIDYDNPRELRRFITVGTGHSMPDEPHKYIGTTHFGEGALVLHVFEIFRS